MQAVLGTSYGKDNRVCHVFKRQQFALSTVWVKIKYPQMSDFFLANLAKSYQNLIGYLKHGSLASRGILNFEFGLRKSILLKYPNFAFVQGSVDLVIKLQITKSVKTMACASHTCRLQWQWMSQKVF